MLHPVESLCMSAFAVKSYLCADCSIFLPYLNNQWCVLTRGGDTPRLLIRSGSITQAWIRSEI